METNLGLGEYLTLWLILIIGAVAVLGWLFGTAGMGALVFFILGVSAILIVYAIGVRLYRLLLHGSISAGGGGSGGGR